MNATALKVRPFPTAELPRLTRAQVDAGRRLLQEVPLEPGPDWAAACRALGGDVEIALTEMLVLSAGELLGHLRGAAVRISLGRGPQALVVIDPQLAPRLARRALGTDGTPELAGPRPLTAAEEGAIEFLVGALVDRAGVRVDGMVREGELPFSTGASAWIWALGARLTTPVGTGWARLYAPGSLRLSAPPAMRPIFRHRGRLERAPVELRIELGRATLPSSELAALAAGDVLLPGLRAPHTRLALRVGRGRFGAHLAADTLVIDDPYRVETSMTNESDASELAGELPVEVTCELGRITLTGREVLELRPGAVLPVGRPLSGPIDLTVGGRVVARGELVDVDGEIGVRVTQTVD
jgi:flagellar motor switch protein FliM